MTRADRYTTLSIHRDSLPGKLAEASSLRLKFLVRPDWGDKERVYLYLFFDDKAMHNYLAENYGSFADDVRTLTLEYPQNDELFGAAVRRVLAEIDTGSLE